MRSWNFANSRATIATALGHNAPAMTAPLIAHIVFRLDYGGLENGLVNLINGLPTEKYRHAVICLSGYSDFHARIHRPDVNLHALGKRPGQDPGCYLRLRRLLRSLRPALVHTRNTGTIDCAPVAWSAGIPLRVHGCHGWDAGDLHGRRFKGRLLRQLSRPFIHHYVAVSADMAAWLTDDNGISEDQITHICNGVDTARFHPSDGLAWHAGQRPLIIGTVGRLDPVKDQTTLITALASLKCNPRPGWPELRLRIVGEGPERAALEHGAREAGISAAVELPGARDDIPDQLRGMDVFVLPSLNEGISNTLLEAMASGLPVIATRVGGNPELVADGQTGWLVAPRSPTAIAERLARYLDDPALASQHGAEARRRTENQFSIASMLRSYDALYSRLLQTTMES